MTEPTSLSTPQSQNAEVAPSSENSTSVKQEVSWLSDIPLLTQSKSSTQPQKPLESLESSEPSSCENNHEETVEGKYEYEFSLCFDGSLCFVYLYDSTDISACERIIHRPVAESEISYSSATGNGFIEDAGFRYTFTKQPYKRTYSTHTDIKAGVRYENHVAQTQKKHKMTADDILSSL